MRRKNYKGRCEKRVLSKCQDVCRTYDEIQYAYADILERSSSIKKFNCNVPLEDMEGDIYTSDFVCLKMDGDIMVRECVRQSLISKPMTVKLLDISRTYWLRSGVTDWGLVINEEK